MAVNGMKKRCIHCGKFVLKQLWIPAGVDRHPCCKKCKEWISELRDW